MLAECAEDWHQKVEEEQRKRRKEIGINDEDHEWIQKEGKGGAEKWTEKTIDIMK